MKRPDLFEEMGLDYTPDEKRAVYHALGELAAAGIAIDLRTILRILAPPATTVGKPIEWERYMGRKPNNDTE